jgi:hypothetical protein
MKTTFEPADVMELETKLHHGEKKDSSYILQPLIMGMTILEAGIERRA